MMSTKTWRRWSAPAVPAVAVATALSALALAAPSVAAEPPPQLVKDPAAYVDTLDGTGIGGESVGSINNFPGPATPFGMVQFSPDTTDTYAGYLYSRDRIKGFSLNHASVGCNAFGDIPILPTTGDVGRAPWDRSERFTHDGEVGQPGYYAVTLPDAGIRAELTATTRAGLATFTFPKDKAAQVLVRSGGSLGGNSAATVRVEDDHTISGSATTGSFCGKSNRYTVHYVIQFDRPFTASGTWDGSTVTPDSTSADASRAGAYATFPAGSVVHAKASLSYTDAAGAKANLAKELPGWDAGAVRAATRQQWTDALGRIRVAGRDAGDLETFYTSLYRSLLHPNAFSDVDGRYLGFDDTVHTTASGRTQYANFSDWDTYRSLAPLQAMLFPKQASDFAQSLVEDAKQGGALPRWALANDATGQMTGDSVVPFISQVHAFGATDFDARTALRQMVAGATTGGKGRGGYVERPGIATYLDRGYAPQTQEFRGDHRVVGASITLEWSIDDFTIGRLAQAIGDTTTAAAFQKRSQYWQNLLNPATRCISPRDAAGRFPDGPCYQRPTSGFGQAGFDEGNAEQYVWLVPQNVGTLVTALGGRDAVADRLDTFMKQLNVGANEPFMWAGNEPNFQTPWLYNYLGRPWRTQEVVDRIRTTLFGPTPNGEPGNDDLGAQSSWYVWASLGLYPTTPGTTQLTVNTPAFDKVEITRPSGRPISISAPGASSGARYISRMSVDGKTVDRTVLPDTVLQRGGDVAFKLSTSRVTSWATGVGAAPPSYAEGTHPFVASATPGRLVVTPGASGRVDVSVQRLAGSTRTFSVATSASDGVTVTGPSDGAYAADGSGRVALEVAVPADAADGYRTVDVTVASGGRTVTEHVTVLVARPGSLTAAMDVVGTADESDPGVADLDGAGNSLSRQQLAAVGLTPGSLHDASGTRFTWPSSPVGEPDTLAPAGQKVTLSAPARRVVVVGTGINGGGRTTATATLDDGSTVPVDVSFGDWVLPSGSGDPVYGNTVVAHMAERNASSSDHGAYVFATAPFDAPAGRTVTALTFPSTDRLRVFAIGTAAP